MSSATVKVISGRKLMVADFRTSDPYVKIVLFDQNEAEIGRQQTEVINSNLNPDWNWSGDFSLREDTKISKIIFDVYDKDTVGADDFMGQAIVFEDELNRKKIGIETTLSLAPMPDVKDDAAKEYAKKGTLGNINVSWVIKYPEPPKINIPSRIETTSLSTTGSTTATPTPRSGISEHVRKQLMIRPLSITGLPSTVKDWKRGDLLITVGEDTTVVSGTCSRGSVRWHSVPAFKIHSKGGGASPDRQKATIKFEIIDTKKEKQNSIAIGSKTITVGDFTTGSIETLKLVMDDDLEATLQVEFHFGIPSSSRTPSLKKSSPRLEPRVPQSILLSISKGRDFVKMDMMGSSDPFVIATVEGSVNPLKKFQTKHISNTLNPEWTADFDIDLLEESDAYIIHFNVYDRDSLSDNEWMGYASLHLTPQILMSAIPSARTDELTLGIRPGEENKKSDEKLLKKNKGKLGFLTVSIRSDEPPFPVGTRIECEESKGFIKSYNGTNQKDDEKVQMYTITTDEGEDQIRSSAEISLCGDIDTFEDVVDRFRNGIERRNETLIKLMTDANESFFEDNYIYFDSARHPNPTPEERALRKYFVEYGNIITHFNCRYEAALDRHSEKYIEEFMETDGNPAKRVKIISSEKEHHDKIGKKWEVERKKLQEEQSLSAVVVKSAKLIVSSVRDLEDEPKAVFGILVTSVGSRATAVAKVNNGCADFKNGKQKSTHFPGLDPGEEGTLLTFTLHVTDVERIGSLPTEDMSQTEETIAWIRDIEIPKTFVSKGDDLKSITKDLGWLPATDSGNTKLKTEVRVKLILEIESSEKKAIEKRMEIAEKAAKEAEEAAEKERLEEEKLVPSILEVGIVSGSKLIIRDLRSSDPYCVVEVLSLDANKVIHINKTAVIDSDLNPIWKERFSYDVVRLLQDSINNNKDESEIGLKLRFTVWDDDAVGNDDFMGYVDMPIDKKLLKSLTRKRAFNLMLGKRPATNQKITAEDQKLWKKHKEFFGTIKVTLRTSEPVQFGSSAEQTALAAAAIDHDRKQQSLTGINYKFDANPGDITFETFGRDFPIKTIEPNSSAAMSGLEVGMNVIAYNGISISGKKKEVKKLLEKGGEMTFTIGLDDVIECTFKANKNDVSYKQEGLCIRVTEVAEGSDAHENGLRSMMRVYAMNSSPVTDVKKLQTKTLSSETTLTCVDESLADRLQADEMLLNVFARIVKAKKLVRADVLGSSDPYVIAYAIDKSGNPLTGRAAKEGMPLKTKVVSNSLSPSWDFSFPAPVVMREGEKLRFEVWDDDAVGDDDFLGHADLNPWDDKYRDTNNATDPWLILKHRGNTDDTTIAKHTSGESPLGQLLVSIKSSIIIPPDDDPLESSTKDVALDEQGHLFEKVEHKESIRLTITSLRGVSKNKCYMLLSLNAPGPIGGRQHEFKTALGKKESGIINFNDGIITLQFDDCGEDQVEGFLISVMEKSFIGGDNFIGKIAISKKEDLWVNGCKGDWLELQPKTQREKQNQKKPIGDLYCMWDFSKRKEFKQRLGNQSFSNIDEAQAKLDAEETKKENQLPIYERMRGEGYNLTIEIHNCDGFERSETTVEVTCGGKTERSDPSPKTNTPEWQTAIFYFPIESFNSQVEFRVMHGSHLLGSAKHGLANEVSLTGTKTIPIPTTKGSSGSVSFSWTYNHEKGLSAFLPEFKGEKPQQIKQNNAVNTIFDGLPVSGSSAKLTIVQAANLARNPKVKIVMEYRRKETKLVLHKESARYPLLNATHDISIAAKGGTTANTSGADGEILLKFYDSGIITNTFIGQTIVNLIEQYDDCESFTTSDEFSSNGLKVNNKLVTHINGEHCTNADLIKNSKFPIEFTFEKERWYFLQPRKNQVGRPEEDDSKLLEEYGSLGRVLLRWTHNLQINKRELEMEDENEGEPTCLITIFEGEKLIPCDVRTSDPYLLVEYGEEMSKTATIKSTLTPKWDETLPAMPIKDGETLLQGTCMDLDWNADDFMGRFSLNPLEWVLADNAASGRREREGWIDLVPRESNKDDDELYQKHGSFGRIRIKITLKGDLSTITGNNIDLKTENKEQELIALDQLKTEGGMLSIWVDKAEALSTKADPLCKYTINNKEYCTHPCEDTNSPAWLAGPYSMSFPKATENTKNSIYDMKFEIFDKRNKEVGEFKQSALELTTAAGTKEIRLRIDEDDEDDPTIKRKALGKLTFRWEINIGAKDMAPWLDPERRATLKEWLQESKSKLRLSLTIIRCSNLINLETFGRSDPYVIASCGPNRTQTRVVSSNCSPVFNHTTSWDLISLEQPIEFSIKDKEDLQTDRDLGFARLNLATVSDEKGEQSIPIEATQSMKGDKDSYGHLVVKYQIEKVDAASSTVRFSIVEAQNLADPNMIRDITPKVCIEFIEGSKKRKFETKTAKGKEPTWMENFDFDLNSSDKVKCTLSAWEDDTCLGTFKQELDFLGNDNTGDIWVTLHPRAGSDEDALLQSKFGTLGQIHIQWESDTPEAKLEREMRRELRLKQLYEANMLNFKVVRARGLPNKMILSPQCWVLFPATCAENEIRKSKTVSGTSPVFGVDASWKLSTQMLNQEVEIQIWDIGLFSKTVLGKASINVWDNATDIVGERWLKLSEGGEIFVSWELCNEFAPSRMVLQVWIEKAIDLVIPVGSGPKSSSDTASLSSTVDLGPYKRRTDVVEAHKGPEIFGIQKSSVSWGKLFEFDPIPPSHQFSFELWDRRQMEEDLCLGQVIWDWGNEPDINDGRKTFPIKGINDSQQALSKKSAGLGQLSIKWSTVMRQHTGIRDGQKVQCKIMKARGLPQVDNPMRVYAVVSMGGEKEMSDTTLNNELDFNVQFRAENEGQEIRIEMWERNYGLISDTHLGYTEIPYGRDEASSGEDWLRLKPRQGVEADYELSAKHDGYLGEIRTSWQWDTETSAFTKTKSKRTRADLEVRIVNAQNLTPQDMNGLSDPYVVVKHDNIKFKTKTIDNSLDPHWNETFHFTDTNIKCPVMMTLWDADIEASDFMGRASFIPKAGKTEGRETIALKIRSGNKEDVKLQEKYGGNLGTISIEWKVTRVVEEDEGSSNPLAILSLSVLSAKVHVGGKECYVEAIVGSDKRKTKSLSGQALLWDREGLRESWKIPITDDDSKVLLQLVDAKSKKVIAAKYLVDELVDTSRRHHVALYQYKDDDIITGSPSGDMIDIECLLHKYESRTVDSRDAADLQRWCGRCRNVVPPQSTLCPVCGEKTQTFDEMGWKAQDTSLEELGPVSLGGVVKCDQTGGAVGQLCTKVGPKAYVYGGINKSGYCTSFKVFDSNLMRWKEIEKMIKYPRYGATMIHYQDKLLIFGGFGPGGLDAGLSAMGGTIETDSHVMEVGTDNDFWEDPNVSVGNTGGYHDTVVSYDISTKSWKDLPSHGSGWDFRACHSAVLYKSRMIVYGGWSIFIKQQVFDSSKRLGRLSKPNVKYSTIECRRGDVASYNISSGKWSWCKPLHGDTPPPRSHHTAVLKPQSCFMFVFGGATIDNNTTTQMGDIADVGANPHKSIVYLNDTQVFDLRNKVWCSTGSGDIPEPRAEHAATTYGGSMLIVGGRGGKSGKEVFGQNSCYQLAFSTGIWRKINTTSNLSKTLTSSGKAEVHGRWGLNAVAFKPKIQKNTDSELTRKQLALQEQKKDQKARGQQLLRLLGDDVGEDDDRFKLTAKDLKVSLLVIGGCERFRRVSASKKLSRHGGDDKYSDKDSSHSSLQPQSPKKITKTTTNGSVRLSGTVHPPEQSRDSVLANLTSPVACTTLRLTLPNVPSTASAEIWQIVPSNYSVTMKGGETMTGGVPIIKSGSSNAVQARPAWVDPGMSTAGSKVFAPNSGGGPARRVPVAPESPKEVKKVTEAEMANIMLRMDRVHRLSKPPSDRRPPKEYPLPVMAKRQKEDIAKAVGMLSEGHSTTKGKRIGRNLPPAPGDLVKVRNVIDINDIHLISGTPGVISQPPVDRKLKPGYINVKFHNLTSATPVRLDDIHLMPKKRSGFQSEKFGIAAIRESQKSTSRRTAPSPAALTSPPKYEFPDQWLADETEQLSDYSDDFN